MKRKLLTLSCAIVLCFSLTSCGLKSAITGDKTASTEDSKATETNSENKDNITNTEATEETTTTASDQESSDDAVLTNNNSFVENNSSNVTPDKSSLSSTTNTVNRDCRVFYFNKVYLKAYCVDTSVKVTDNAFVTALTEKLYSAPNNNNNFVVLSKDYGVNSATLNYDTNVLTVVFNENFIKDMDLSTDVANGVIGAIVNTYGYNYGVDKVAVYFGNELYTGIEGTSSAGYSTVNYSDALKLD